LKIAFVSEHASPLAAVGGTDSGGQNVHVAELARALGAHGHEVTVYTRRDGGSLRNRVRLSRGVTVEHVPAGPATEVPKDRLLPYMAPFGRYLAERWQREPPDVVHAHFWMSGMAALAGARDLGLPVTQTFHALGVVKRRHQGAEDTSPESRIRLEVGIARDVATVLATSSDEAFELARLGVPGQRISVIPCGVNTESFRPDGPAARRGKAPRLLAAGRLVKRKGLETIVRALPDVPKAELVVAGGPAPARLRGDPEYRRVSRLAAELGVADRVSFRGRVGRGDMPALMRSADLVVSVPWYEPFGMVPLEAMACGVPVVASAVGGHTDTVVDGVTGVLVPPRQPAKLAGVLRDLLALPDLRGYGTAAAERAHGRYSWERISQDTAAVYERIRRGRPAAPAGRTASARRAGRAGSSRRRMAYE
jgi:glycosyltransferase involved in cell wall biosynthesis